MNQLNQSKTRVMNFFWIKKKEKRTDKALIHSQSFTTKLALKALIL